MFITWHRNGPYRYASIEWKQSGWVLELRPWWPLIRFQSYRVK